jgi:hypothetical protein
MQELRERLAVKPEDLRRRVDPAMLPFQTTAEVAPAKTTIGQPRAAEAIAFALEVGVRGFFGRRPSGRTVVWRYRRRLGAPATRPGSAAGTAGDGAREHRPGSSRSAWS